MEDLKDGITRKETLLKGHRIHLRKRSDIAKDIARYKSKSKTKKDVNTIMSLNAIFKQSKQKSLDVKRTSAICKKNDTPRQQSYKLLLAVRNQRSVQPSISESFLKDMGLSIIGTARFFSNSESSLKSLERVRPFVYYGTPTQRHVKELLNKRGTIILPNGVTRLISTNSVIEEHIGRNDILCISDIVKSIYNGDENAEDILSKLGTLNMSINSLECPLKCGDIGTSINETLDLI
ncbi:hypothetical protein, conserved [Babesia bigemina]|uniref:Uncharacterized protein n=1 Tax=Babesia bigemina TaxID=5866 RepID=A0A061D066_BABBI|nr:hypothetical protein, conserved [Babesia bigemina]CDR94226.1 hypothetical protein, conserved [Babesia bigemina]|eukprot:XP_012766412.1 hypothetical protein, conserved [Babesia bigemina]